MTSATASKTFKLIHVAKIFNEGQWTYLFLRKKSPFEFVWSQSISDNAEEQTPVSGTSIEEAIRLAYSFWKLNSIAMLNCGFRYSLPERDEHGINALFHQMGASYSSMNGVYFDEESGNNCFINFASDEAKDLWKKLKSQERM